MQTIIKWIREYLNMSQTGFAKLMNVTFATVNRWENGHAMPNRLAQSRLYDICQEGNVPVYTMTLRRIEEMKTAVEISLEPGSLLLYHCSQFGIENSDKSTMEDMSENAESGDFGKGFYMGTDPEQMLTMSCDFEKFRFYIVSIDMTDLVCLNLPVSFDWAMLVAYHRGKMEEMKEICFYRKCREMASGKDLIIGNIVDDNLLYMIDNFFIGSVTDAVLVNSLSAFSSGRQYAAVTLKSRCAVRMEAEIRLSCTERKFIKKSAEEKRTKTASLVSAVCEKYRREGMFFDEILDLTRE